MAKTKRSRVPVKIEAAGDTHIGGRTHNEDAIVLRPDLNLYMVADGAGGQNAGNVASSLATTTIAHFFEQTHTAADKLAEFDGLGLPTAARRLSAAVQDANKEILEIAATSDRHKGMGTTIVAALFDVAHRALHIAYVGDSRCYRLRDGRMELLTFDHSLINDVLELRPNIADDRVKKLPQNVITRALGMSENLRVSVRSHLLLHGDRYMMCSDGLSDVVSDGQIAEALSLGAACDEQVALLVQMALDAHADDNVAVVIIDCSLPSGSVRASTKPVRKVSRPHMKKAEVVPEIVLYDSVPQKRDSSPLIHVVPPAASSEEVVDAVHNVVSDRGSPRPKLGSRPPPPMPPGSNAGARNKGKDDDEGRYSFVGGSTSPRKATPQGPRRGATTKAITSSEPRGEPVEKPSLFANVPARRKVGDSLSAPRRNKPDVESTPDPPPSDPRSETPTKRPFESEQPPGALDPPTVARGPNLPEGDDTDDTVPGPIPDEAPLATHERAAGNTRRPGGPLPPGAAIPGRLGNDRSRGDRLTPNRLGLRERIGAGTPPGSGPSTRRGGSGPRGPGSGAPLPPQVRGTLPGTPPRVGVKGAQESPTQSELGPPPAMLRSRGATGLARSTACR